MLEVKKNPKKQKKNNKQTNNASNHTLPEQQYKKIPKGGPPHKHNTCIRIN